MTRVTFVLIALLAVTLAVTLGSWLGSGPSDGIPNGGPRYGVSADGNAVSAEDPWFLGEDTGALAQPEPGPSRPRGDAGRQGETFF